MRDWTADYKRDDEDDEEEETAAGGGQPEGVVLYVSWKPYQCFISGASGLEEGTAMALRLGDIIGKILLQDEFTEPLGDVIDGLEGGSKELQGS